MWNTGKRFFAPLILIFTISAFSQDTLPEPCHSDFSADFTQKYLADEATPEQIKIWYSFGSEYAKQREYAQAMPYLWKVFINDSAKAGRYSIQKIADGYFYQKFADSTLIACYRSPSACYSS